MDKIILSGLEIFAYHGVNAEEKRDGQRFIVDAELFCSLEKPSLSGRIEDTVNYAQVRKTIQRVFTAQKDDLIERAGRRVIDALLEEFAAIREIRLTVKKPDAPMNAKFDFAGIQLEGRRPPRRAVLGLGSNLGNRLEYLEKALKLIDSFEETRLLRCSHVYETEPVDAPGEQGKYLNMCAEIETGLLPQELLLACQRAESLLLRARTEYHGARTMDIDILLFEGFSSDSEKLTLPHPRLLERAFVLFPLRDLFPDCKALGLDISGSYKEQKNSTGVKRII